MPPRNLFNGLCFAAAGIMLVIPGIITDIIGISLLLPAVRGHLYDLTLRHAADARVNRRRGDPDVIEGEYIRLRDPE